MNRGPAPAGSNRSKPILVVCGVDPRAPIHGIVMRIGLTIKALAKVAPVHVAVIRPAGDRPVLLTSEVPAAVSRLEVFLAPSRLTLGLRARWWARPVRPLQVLGRDLDALRNELDQWLVRDYALAWVIGAALAEPIQPLIGHAPLVVDYNDLESDKAEAEWRNRWGGARPMSPVDWLKRQQGKVNIGAWRRLEQRVLRMAARAFVCSSADAGRLDSGKVGVIPNAYPDPGVPPALTQSGTSTILFQGSMVYPPNVDGAEFLVREVLPHLARKVPDVRVRLVGRAGARVRDLGDDERVVITGYVPDMRDELGRAAVVVAPIRFGGGTRVKIIEALAHGVPVVSTHLGAYGLGLAHGQEILLADTAEAFADCCATLLQDQPLADRLTQAGRDAYERSFTEEAVVRQVVEVAVELSEGGRPGA